jgi:hypothetical protein
MEYARRLRYFLLSEPRIEAALTEMRGSPPPDDYFAT